ncbi:MAG TPA: hypothetical protein VFR97_14845 [Capillimicrobium sp.]|nr:hypothetical protein [Capillimicrobium sp.]
MADPRVFELDDLVNRPGTYYNPQTEVLIVVDDSPALDQEIFGDDSFEATDWVLVADEVPVDEHERDALIDAFAVKYHPGSERSYVDSDDVVSPDENAELEPDEDEE